MPPTFEQLEEMADNYMLLTDRGVFRLLLAFVLARKLPAEPPFLFIIGSSSGGKTKLLQLLSKVPGYTEMGDLTANTFLSGLKRSDKETSLLFTLEADSFLTFKDWTTILSKYKEQMGALMGQLREIYDGSFNKRTGHGDNLQWKGKVALLAGVTTAMYVHQKDMADMGERMLYYHLKQPNNLELGRWIMTHKKRDEKKLEEELQTAIQAFEASRSIPLSPEELPDFDIASEEELIEIAYLATGARSPIERKQYDRNERITMAHDREQIGRFLKQLRVIAYGLCLLNDDRVLTPRDKSILYRIGLDSIPITRKWVLDALTENKLGGNLHQLADYLKYPSESVEKWVEDLVALGLVHNTTQYFKGGSVKTYRIVEEYADIIAKFEHIEVKEKALPASEQDKVEQSSVEEPPPPVQKEIYL